MIVGTKNSFSNQLTKKINSLNRSMRKLIFGFDTETNLPVLIIFFSSFIPKDMRIEGIRPASARHCEEANVVRHLERSFKKINSVQVRTIARSV